MQVKWTLALLVFLLIPARASAHASLLSSNPSNGAVLTSSPMEIRLVFSEPIVIELSQMMLAGPGARTIRLDSRGDPHEVRALIATLPSLANGGYRVDWHIISADGHPVSGSVTFSVGAAAAVPPKQNAGDRHGFASREPVLAGAALIPAILRGMSLSAVLAACGLLGFAGYSTVASNRQKRLCAWLSGTATVLLTAHLLSWLVHVSPASSLDGEIARNALSREAGLDELVRLILTALALWAVILARRLRLAFAFALAAVIAGGAIGHPAAIDPIITIPSKALHLVGVAFWLGGLLWLATSDAASSDVASSAGMVSSVSLISIIVVALTGIVQSFLFLTEWTDIYSTAYGLTLVGKTAGLLGLASFGAYHRWRLMPRLAASGADAPLFRSVRREIALMITIVLLGGFLAYVPVPQKHTPRMSSTPQGVQ